MANKQAAADLEFERAELELQRMVFDMSEELLKRLESKSVKKKHDLEYIASVKKNHAKWPRP
jgi:23S rRNA maturation-related 3'-5' exoribonuclease YhaM